jgi:hypothetical protein
MEPMIPSSAHRANEDAAGHIERERRREKVEMTDEVDPQMDED